MAKSSYFEAAVAAVGVAVVVAAAGVAVAAVAAGVAAAAVVDAAHQLLKPLAIFFCGLRCYFEVEGSVPIRRPSVLRSKDRLSAAPLLFCPRRSERRSFQWCDAEGPKASALSRVTSFETSMHQRWLSVERTKINI